MKWVLKTLLLYDPGILKLYCFQNRATQCWFFLYVGGRNVCLPSSVTPGTTNYCFIKARVATAVGGSAHDCCRCAALRGDQRARSMRSVQAGRSDARDMRRRARSGHDSGSSCPSLSGPDLMIQDNYSHTVTAVHARARRSLLFRKHRLLALVSSAGCYADRFVIRDHAGGVV